jgi:hypothetical protein
MNRVHVAILIALAIIAGLIFGLSPAHAATLTTSAQLESLAKVLEQNAVPNSTLNSQLLTLVKEPAKTLDGMTTATSAALYTTTIDTALKLRPKGWLAGGTEQMPAAAMGVNCTASMSFWLTDPNLPNGGPGLRMETFAWGKGNCASVLSAAIARAWAYKLRQVGR